MALFLCALARGWELPPCSRLKFEVDPFSNTVDLSDHSFQYESIFMASRELVWRTGAFSGQFCDAYIENTELEGGKLGPSCQILAHILANFGIDVTGVSGT
jgi:hypothetical protein